MSKPTPDKGDGTTLELYKLAVEMADRVSGRRASANSFFFSLQAALTVALGAFAVNTGPVDEPEPDRFVLVLAALSGVVISISWWLLLRSYRRLNTAKFEVINKIEEDHFELHLFSDEWKKLKTKKSGYAEQGSVEQVVPLLFAVIYLTLAVYIGCFT